jgi:hypothetical protein
MNIGHRGDLSQKSVRNPRAVPFFGFERDTL